MLALSSDLLTHVLDQPWPGCTVHVFGVGITWMSSGILSMLLAGAVLVAGGLWMARRPRLVPTGGQNFLESVVVFVRDTIARPALHERAEDYLPFLTTLFVFVFTLNVMGLVPLESLSLLLGVNETHRLGGTPTAIPVVGAALASLALLAVVGSGLRISARAFHDRHGWPLSTCWVLSPVLWFVRLSPSVPGVIGKVILVPMALLELVSAIAKSVALMVRLCANMIAGHMLLAVLLGLGIQAIRPMLVLSPTDPGFHAHGFWALPLCAVASAALTLMELLVAGIQAFIFAIMVALFLAMYAETSH